jgi:hypothetical protein
MICNINFNDLFTTAAEMKAFNAVFDKSVGDFAKDNNMPPKIKEICSIISGNAISLLYDKNEDVLTKLNGCDPKTACEKEYLLIEFVSQPQRFRSLLEGPKDVRDKILRLYKKVAWYLGSE